MALLQTGESDVCRRCALEGTTCCQMTPGQEDACFPLSLKEKEIIQEVLPDTGGFELSPNSKAFTNYICRLFPGEEESVRALFPEGKEHFRLALDSMGACRFLGPSGCVIPYEARPYYCRLYPFWMVERDVIFFDSASCLARREERTLHRMLHCFKNNRANVRNLYGKFRLVWGLPPLKGASKVNKGF